MTLILGDDDIRRHLRAAAAVEWIGAAVDAHHRGDFLAPPRSGPDRNANGLVFTTGHLRGSWYGYRSYDAFSAFRGGEIVVVNDEAGGTVRAVALGSELGPRRVGATGAVAAQSLTSPSASVVGLIGTGAQAVAQLWALSAVRTLGEIRVYSRDAGRREEFSQQQRAAGLPCFPATSARSAVSDAEIVILATDSRIPVIDASWLRPDAHVTAVGPKRKGHTEFGADLLAAAETLVTDSLAQVDDFDPPTMLADPEHRERLVSLGALRAEGSGPRGSISLFVSVGLAGTEAYLLHELITSRPSSFWKVAGAAPPTPPGNLEAS